MSKAAEHPTTPLASVVPHASRRGLLTGLASTTLVGATFTTAATAPTDALAAPSLDAELIAACAEYHRLHAVWHGPFIDDDTSDDQCRARQAAMVRVSELPAMTPGGLRAKAGVAHGATMFLATTYTNVPWCEQATPEQALAIDVLAGFLGVEG